MIARFSFSIRLVILLFLLCVSPSVCPASDDRVAVAKDFLITASDQFGKDIEAVRSAADFASAVTRYCDSFEKYLTVASELEKLPQSEKESFEGEWQKLIPELERNTDMEKYNATVTAATNLARKFDTSPGAVRAWQRFEEQKRRMAAFRDRNAPPQETRFQSIPAFSDSELGQLYAADANAFERKYVGQDIQIRTKVLRIEGGEVTLGTPMCRIRLVHDPTQASRVQSLRKDQSVTVTGTLVECGPNSISLRSYVFR